MMIACGRGRARHIVCGVTIATLAGLLFAGCGERRSDQYLQQGATYLRLQKYGEAEETYRWALQANPHSVQARLGLGQCLIALGKTDEALGCFQEIIAIAPEDDRGYLETARLLLRMGKTDEALATAQRLEAVNAELGGVLHTSLLLNLGRHAEARDLLAGLQERFPDSVTVRTHSAAVLLATGQAAEAEAALKAVIQQDPAGATGAKVLLVEALAAQGRVAEMLAQQEMVSAEDSDQAMVTAHALILADRAEEGAALLRGVLEQNPRAPWACFVLGAHLMAMGRREEAGPFLQVAAESLPWEAAVMHGPAREHRSEPAAPVLAPPDAQRAPADRIISDAAALEDWQRLWRQGALRRLVDERERFRGQPGAHLQETLSLAALFLGNFALAEALAGELPADSPLIAYLEALKQQTPREAVNALEPWMQQEDAALGVLALNAAGYAMAITGARGQAVQVLSECVERFPDNGVSLINLAQVFRAANMPQFAARALSRLTSVSPENIEAHALLFRVLREAGMHQAARQAAEVMYALFPDSREASLAVCGIYMDGKDPDLAMRVADRYLQSHPQDGEMLMTKASVLLRKGRIEDALEVLGNIPPSDVLAPGIASMTALSRALLHDWQGVIDVINPVGQTPIPLTQHFILAAAHIKRGEKDQAATVMTQADSDEPLGGLAGRIILHALGRPMEALAAGDRALAEALAGNDAAIADFAAGAACQVALMHDDAYVAFKRVDDALAGDHDTLVGFMFSSLPHLARVEDIAAEGRALAERHASRPRAWLGYAGLLQKIEDAAGERAALDKAAEVGPDDPQVFLRRGDFFSRIKDPQAAAVEYRRLLQLRPNDPVGNNNLAYHLILTEEDNDEALRCARLAAQSLPMNPHVLHTLGVALLRNGDLEESRKNLMTALQLMPGDPSLLLDYGELLITLGDIEGGRRHIESALANTRALDLDFDRQAEAEALLAKQHK